ncbi:HNH endonuclease [Brachybacterium sp. MASK1Z-5]|uniref:HNH endonuclease n=1 Tax=Brachybacterium halotolerans TaxID=2795215 RepID=A0ABS1BA45_9MICO|nr:HNH endonuclease [Brachybacterium halotolerans]MBK0331547.1 HNH endonuclease [Brachybacterium halotolerans]
MTDWIIPSDPTTFDIDQAFLHLEDVHWSEAPNAHIQVGDRAFMYQGAKASLAALSHCCEVVQTGLPYDDQFTDREFWLKPNKLSERRSRTWILLHGIRAFSQRERALLTREDLRAAGMARPPQNRRRAPEDVSALVDRVLKMRGEDADQRVVEESRVLADLGFSGRTWTRPPRQSWRTTSLAAYETALRTPSAATSLALLRAYLDASELASNNTWAVSAWPQWANTAGSHRFATVNGSNIELFYVWVNEESGEIESWGLRLPSHFEDSVTIPDDTWINDADNGDISVNGTTLEQLLHFLDDEHALGAVRDTALERARRRRSDWHNPFLAAVLASESPLSETDHVDSTTVEDVEFERRYIERVTRTRRHQAPLRRAALIHYAPPACHYCGLDVAQVLDTAHIVPDREGGAASVKNVRLLCANHHRAFDAELLVWDPVKGVFTRQPDSPDVAPLPTNRRDPIARE